MQDGASLPRLRPGLFWRTWGSPRAGASPESHLVLSQPYAHHLLPLMIMIVRGRGRCQAGPADGGVTAKSGDAAPSPQRPWSASLAAAVTREPIRRTGARFYGRASNRDFTEVAPGAREPRPRQWRVKVSAARGPPSGLAGPQAREGRGGGRRRRPSHEDACPTKIGHTRRIVLGPNRAGGLRERCGGVWVQYRKTAARSAFTGI